MTTYIQWSVDIKYVDIEQLLMVILVGCALRFYRVSGVYVPVRRRTVSTRVRVVQRGGDVCRQIGRVGRPVRRRCADDRRQQDIRHASPAAVDPGPRRLPAQPGRMPFPV